MFKRIPALRALVVAGAGAAAFTFSAVVLAQETPPPQAAPVAQAQQPVERIEVTGSLIRRVEAETSLPVEVITKEQIERQGATNAEQILQNITSTSAVGGFVGAQTVGLSTYAQSSASLRALGSYRTLVLINGRRMADFPAGATQANPTTFDLNAIPASAIERIEILQDGASSIYGSEAMAGVINVILRQNYKGIEASAYLGTPTREGGGRIEKFGVVFGGGDYNEDRFNAFVSIDGEHDQPLYAIDRSFAVKGWDPVLGDFSATPTGAIDGQWVPGLLGVHQPNLNYFGTIFDNNQCGLLGPGIQLDVNYTGIPSTPFPNVGSCRFNPEDSTGVLIPKTDRIDLLSRVNFKLNDNTKLFGEFVFAHTKTDLLQQPSPYSSAFLLTDLKFGNPAFNPPGAGYVNAAPLVNPTNWYYQNLLVPFAIANPAWQGAGLVFPTGTLPANYTTANACMTVNVAIGCYPLAVRYRAFEGGRRDQSDAADAFRLSLGAVGTAFDFDYDITVADSRSRVENDTEGGFESELAFIRLINGLQGPTQAGSWNPFGTQSPAIAAQMAATDYNGLAFKGTVHDDSLDAKASRPIFDLAGGPLSAALGTSMRHESISIDAPAIFLTGDVSGYGAPIPSFSNGRSSYAAYGELDAPIIKQVELDVSVRSDKYTGTGGVTSPKASLRLQPDERLLLRASVGKGFRAPSLGELFSPALLGTSANISDPAHKALPPAQYSYLLGGNPNLDPEKSRQDSFGLVFEPIKDASISVDYFAVRIANSIGAIGVEEAIGLAYTDPSKFGSLVQRTPVPPGSPAGTLGTIVKVITTNQNLGTLDVTGYEVNLRWRSAPFSFGRITTTLTGTYMDQYNQQLPNGTYEGSIAKTVNPQGNVLSVIGNNGGVIQRWKHNLDIVLEQNDWSVSLTQHFQSAYADMPDNFGNPHNIGCFSTWDGQVSSQVIKDLRASLGLKNIFDRNPPEAAYGLFFQSGFDPTYYDARARFVYGTLTYKFK